MFGIGKRAWRKALGISNAQRQASKALGIRLSDRRLAKPKAPRARKKK